MKVYSMKTSLYFPQDAFSQVFYSNDKYKTKTMIERNLGETIFQRTELQKGLWVPLTKADFPRWQVALLSEVLPRDPAPCGPGQLLLTS